MRTDAGIVLYVIARDAYAARRRGPRRGKGLNKSEIEEQVGRYQTIPSDYRKTSLNPCCEQLIAEQYLRLQGKRYVLHPKATKLTLIQDELGARLVFALYDLISAKDLENPFLIDDALRACDVKLPDAERDEVQAKLVELAEIKGADYFKTFSRGKWLELQTETVNEERPYLDCVVMHKFKAPRPMAHAESGASESEQPKLHKRGR